MTTDLEKAIEIRNSSRTYQETFSPKGTIIPVACEELDKLIVQALAEVRRETAEECIYLVEKDEGWKTAKAIRERFLK